MSGTRTELVAVTHHASRITVVGGGLAGLTLGIGLRRREVPVTIWEAGSYPRHRVCGEFVSGQGQAVLERLGLLDSFLEAGAVYARTAIFFLGNSRSPTRSLPAPALCLSRFAMDALLSRRFKELGGELREKQRWRGQTTGEGIVLATGRRAQGAQDGWRWFGLKAHARNVSSEADLEMHASPQGYVGLTRLNHEWVDVCGLFRAPAGTQAKAGVSMELLLGRPGTLLRQKLSQAVFAECSRCAVAGLSLRPKRAASSPECRIGDALTMIAPATGNGMSMAFEAAERAIEPLAAYSRGEINWAEARALIAADCDRVFARRLHWAGWLQWLMFASPWRAWLSKAALRSDWLWTAMFARTR